MIANETLLALGFLIFAIEYLEKMFLYFTNIINLELTANSVMVKNLGQVVTDFKKEMVKKKNKYMAKRKKRLAKLCAFF